MTKKVLNKKNNSSKNKVKTIQFAYECINHTSITIFIMNLSKFHQQTTDNYYR